MRATPERGWLRVAVGCGLAFLLLALAIRAMGAVTHLDVAIRDTARAHVGPSVLRAVDVLTTVVSPIVDGAVVVAVATVLAVRRRTPAPVVTAAITLALLAAAVLGFKHAFGRPGPLGHIVHGGAFPSGHTASALVVRVLLTMLLRAGRRGVLATAAVTALVGGAMVVGSYHWFSDVVGGALLGVVVITVVGAGKQRWDSDTGG